MKTRYWIALLALLMVLCLGLSLPLFFSGGDARFARIESQGKTIKTLDLLVDQQFTVTTPEGGVNVITVSGGKIAVTEASCPDHVCMARGFRSGGQIVCLPNRLIIRFEGSGAIDGIAE